MASARISRRDLLRRSAITAGALAVGAATGVRPVLGATPGIPVVADNMSYARVWPRTAHQAAALAHFDDTHNVFADGSAEFLLWPGDRKRLDALGVDYQIWTPQPDPIMPRTGSAALRQPGERSQYRVYADYITDMQALATQFPQQAAAFKFAEKTLEGRDMWGIEIADDIAKARVDGRPTFYVDGTHHSREWPSTEYSMMFAFDLLESFTTDAQVAALMSKLRFVIVPCVNPDGFVMSRESPIALTPADQDIPWALAGYLTGWRKNKRSLSNALYAAGGIRGELNVDAVGVDPNRNYSFFWGGEGSGNTTPSEQTYAGTAPFSEPETRNISGMLRGIQATAYLTNHTSGRLCMRPWGFTRDPSPDDEFQFELGERMCEFHNYTNQLAIDLYVTAGSSRDWSYAALRTIVYTFEHGGSFHPAYATTIPQTYAINRPAWLLLAEAAADPANHLVLTGRVVNASGAPVAGAEVKLSKEFNTPTSVQVQALDPNTGIAERLESKHPTRADGTFEIHANPSTRPFTLFVDDTAQETWTVTVGSKTLPVYGERGDRKDLGTITA